MAKTVGHEFHPVAGQRVAPIKAQLAREFRRRQTPAEATGWRALRAGQLASMHFRRQQVIGGFIVDFYCHEAKLVIEVDGPVHDEQQAHDDARNSALSALGLRVLHARNADVEQRLPAVVRMITAHLQPYRARRDGEHTSEALEQELLKLPFPRREGAGG